MLGTGTARVFVRVTVRRVPELVNLMLPQENTKCEEKVSREFDTRLAVLKNMKKPTRRADHETKWAESRRLR